MKGISNRSHWEQGIRRKTNRGTWREVKPHIYSPGALLPQPIDRPEYVIRFPIFPISPIPLRIPPLFSVPKASLDKLASATVTNHVVQRYFSESPNLPAIVLIDGLLL